MCPITARKRDREREREKRTRTWIAPELLGKYSPRLSDPRCRIRWTKSIRLSGSSRVAMFLSVGNMASRAVQNGQDFSRRVQDVAGTTATRRTTAAASARQALYLVMNIFNYGFH